MTETDGIKSVRATEEGYALVHKFIDEIRELLKSSSAIEKGHVIKELLEGLQSVGDAFYRFEYSYWLHELGDGSLPSADMVAGTNYSSYNMIGLSEQGIVDIMESQITVYLKSCLAQISKEVLEKDHVNFIMLPESIKAGAILSYLPVRVDTRSLEGIQEAIAYSNLSFKFTKDNYILQDGFRNYKISKDNGVGSFYADGVYDYYSGLLLRYDYLASNSVESYAALVHLIRRLYELCDIDVLLFLPQAVTEKVFHDIDELKEGKVLKSYISKMQSIYKSYVNGVDKEEVYDMGEEIIDFSELQDEDMPCELYSLQS